ncbi:hypothetical protein [Rubritalea tangerina]|uniref:hypothetical protein n=1 Tax=Rubritalea tangerina TaxID=430798 RepID=UPI00360D3490
MVRGYFLGFCGCFLGCAGGGGGGLITFSIALIGVEDGWFSRPIRVSSRISVASFLFFSPR